MPKTLALTEEIIDAFERKLKAGLASRIGAINAEHNSDPFELRTPLEDDYYIGGAANVPSGRTPSFIITDGGTGEQGGFMEEGSHELQYRTQIIVFMLEEDADRQALARKLLRAERAVIETIWDDEPHEQIEISETNRPHVWPARIQPGPVFNPESEGEPFRQWRAVVFDVQTYV